METRVSKTKLFYIAVIGFLKFNVFGKLIPKTIFIFSKRNSAIKRGFVFFNKFGIYCYVRNGGVKNMIFIFSNFINCEIRNCKIFRCSTAECLVEDCNLTIPHIDTSDVVKCVIRKGAFTESVLDCCILKSRVYDSKLIVCKIEGGFFENNLFEDCIFIVPVDNT